MSPSLPAGGTAASSPAPDPARPRRAHPVLVLMALAGMLLKPGADARRWDYFANSLPISAKAFISMALPLGSLKNIVACSPASPLKRT